ncbi:MAG: bifunctional metallophosphatase/5'-nucleotidase [Alistipes sp.]|nr:bifunctional metallophosphatase/5'-nucleotidase [Candidatus Alistipes equi]
MKTQKRNRLIFLTIVILIVIVLIGVNSYSTRQRNIVVLATNDIHSNINNFARLATAVKECRDTVTTLLVDAGDRWTGNPYVDYAPGRRPILDLMNSLEYDAATLGNHEFDVFNGKLKDAMEYATFPFICCNIQCNNTSLNQPIPYLNLEKDGIKIFLSGIVTNYDNGHPEGYASIFEGMNFPEPMQSAHDIAVNAPKKSIKILLSHIGDNNDYILANKFNDYNIIVSGHTHNVVDTLVNGTVIGQTGSKLRKLGAYRIVLKGNKVQSITYDNIDLSEYSEDCEFKAMLETINANPDLQQKIGEIKESLNELGLWQFICCSIRDDQKKDIGIYHRGGIRINKLNKGDVSKAEITSIDPFMSYIYNAKMSVQQLKALVINKYNSSRTSKESHRIDLIMSVPYTIVVSSEDDAYDVIFPTLDNNRIYDVAVSDYVANNYPQFECIEKECSGRYVVDALYDVFKDSTPVYFENVALQKIKIK